MKGASSGCALNCSQPSPSIRNTQFRSAGVDSVSVAVVPGTAMPAARVGSRSARDPLPYAGTGAESRASGSGWWSQAEAGCAISG
ncbi:hypothetical protein SALBM311S_10201 [Streptomyces alboniger]